MGPHVDRFIPAEGIRLYRFPVRAFPGFESMVHVVLGEGLAVLVDTGSGLEDSNQDLALGLEAISREHGEMPLPEGLTHILVSHGHIDHFGGLNFVRERTRAKIVVHELDLPVLAGYGERLAYTAGRLRSFLRRGGVPESSLAPIMDMYLLPKSLFRGGPVDIVLESQEAALGPLRLRNLPGHCPGLVVARVGEMLLTSDQVLPHTSPHQSPEELMPFTGLSHYLESLRWLQSAPAPRLALGGHEGPMPDLAGRLSEIRSLHSERLGRVLAYLERTHTLEEVSRSLFGKVEGYHVLLALEEAGAHVEYLLERGYLEIANASALESEAEQAVLYRNAGVRTWRGLEQPAGV